ncbi:hypothetical protein RclHR1_12710001 [Rhizophagus clarus]|uniref:Structural maintenance of chromosomes protein n=1 Tax=Rhizophagus clarus TaxID=94130 RepID=A0A2Z6QNG7_9GLOM|nr:hypothetical protein RclHR1_12710001 [Rhizophagus clarus]GES88425.1 structural maintenance of chromosomes protein 4 [Rhizophagus clarus]
MTSIIPDISGLNLSNHFARNSSNSSLHARGSRNMLAQQETPRTSMQQEERKPRIIINKMILTNFKSYFGKQEIGPFHKSFSAIVGPNGSGKSNVIDALLFVFGYRANKMRQTRLSELIHSSQGCENLDSCTVEIHFEKIIDLPGLDNFEVVPQSQLVISRQAYRNNTNKYFINHQHSNYTEVTNLLKKEGIDLDHKRFLILQGEVESISLMKPKAPNEHEDGLLEYLEDIIGTAKYKVSIEEANEKLESLNEERSEKLNRTKIVEKEKQSLEAKKKEAEDYMRDENSLALKKSIIYQKRLLECKNAIEISTGEVNKLKDELREEEEKHAQIKQDNKDLEDKYEEFTEAYQEFEEEVNEILKELANYEKEDIILGERKNHAISKRKKVLKEISADNNRLSEAKTAVKFNEQDKVDQMKEMSHLERSLGDHEIELETIRESLKGKTEVYLTQIEEKQRELSPWSEKINAKQSAIDIAQSEYDFLKERIDSIKKDLEQAEETIVSLQETHRTKEQEILSSKNRIIAIKQEILQIDAKLKDCLRQQENLRSNLADARQRVDEAKGLLQSLQSRDKILSSLTKLKNNGRIKGFHDRLGNLGVIEDKYDIAISTACPALNHIVVDTVDVGQTCIEYLRRNNLGRAMFILLDKLPAMNMHPIPTPENVPRLFDLVRPKEDRFAPAFYSVLKDTLVAKNLQQANRIAFGKTRWRVVTLDGKLIDKSGTMSGGGTKAIRGAMNSKFSSDMTPEIVEKLEQERNHLDEQWKKFNEEIRSLESQLREKKDELRNLELDLSKLEMDSNACVRRISDTEKRISDLRQQNKPNIEVVSRMEQLRMQMDSLTQELEKLKRQSSKIEEEIKGLRDKILEAGGDKLRTQKFKVDQVKEQIAMTNERIIKSQVAKSKAEKDIAKFENSLSKNKRELEEWDNEINRLTEESQQKAETARSIRAKADESKSILEDKRIELDKIKEELDEKTEIINDIRAFELEIKNKLEDSERSLLEHKDTEDKWKNALRSLSLHDISDDEEQDEFQLYTDDELDAMSENTILGEIKILEEKIKNADPNLSVLEQYRNAEKEYILRAKDLEVITTKCDERKKEYDCLRKQRLEEFMHGFTLISQKLKEMYQMITIGGNAELECCDSLDPFSEGIIFSVMPPKKSWKNISNLSGGEKTLSSLALVFALHHYKPTPLYVMDEIDAALDFRNVSIVANYIKERTKDAQFIVISLRNNMFELADRLIGVHKFNDKTESVTMNPYAVEIMLEG